MGEALFIRLRYCFQAGYTLPQFCIDKGIKKPLFVLEKNSEFFLREIYAQFKYDDRLLAQFCFIDNNIEEISAVSFNGGLLGDPVKIKNILMEQIARFDAIIFLTKKTAKINAKKIINFNELERFFIRRTYVDIPLLNFLHRHPGVKLFLTDFPNDIKRYKGGAEFSSQLLDAVALKKALLEGKKVPSSFDKFGYTNEEIANLITIDRAKKNLDGTTSLIDEKDPMKKIHNGKRMTAYQPEKFLNKIYFLGPCHFFWQECPL